jgi:hypothetical protein
MNERIKQIATEVGISVEYLTNTKQIVLLEKFAELIVREVLSQVDEFQRLDSAYKNKLGLDLEINVTKEVLKNFGVENERTN